MRSFCRVVSLYVVFSVGFLGDALAQAGSCVRFRIDWIVYENAPPTVVPGALAPTNTFSLRSQAVAPTHPPLRRGAGSRLGEIVVIGMDASNHEVARTSELDPRGLHLDKKNGSSEYYHWSRTSFSAYMPEDPDIVILKIYEVVSAHTGTGTQMNLLGSIPVVIQ